MIVCLSAAKPISLSVVYPEALANDSAILGAKLAVSQINTKGGVLKRKLVLAQSQLDNKTAINIPPGIIIGIDNNDFAQMLVPKLDKKPYAYISALSSDGELSRAYADYMHLTTLTQAAKLSGLARFSIKQLYRSRAIIISNDTIAPLKTQVNEFKQAFAGYKGTVLNQFNVAADSLSPAQIENLQNEISGVIYLATNHNLNIIKQIRLAKISTPIMLLSQPNEEALKELDKNVADNLFFTMYGTFDRDFMDDNMIAFIKAYQKKYAKKPTSMNAALGYDAVKIAAAAIKQAGTAEPKQVNTAMRKLTDFSGLNGDLNLTQIPPTKTVSIMKIINGRTRIASMTVADIDS